MIKTLYIWSRNLLFHIFLPHIHSCKVLYAASCIDALGPTLHINVERAGYLTLSCHIMPRACSRGLRSSGIANIYSKVGLVCICEQFHACLMVLSGSRGGMRMTDARPCVNAIHGWHGRPSEGQGRCACLKCSGEAHALY